MLYIEKLFLVIKINSFLIIINVIETDWWVAIVNVIKWRAYQLLVFCTGLP